MIPRSIFPAAPLEYEKMGASLVNFNLRSAAACRHPVAAFSAQLKHLCHKILLIAV
jgi:hypothetical protein